MYSCYLSVFLELVTRLLLIFVMFFFHYPFHGSWLSTSTLASFNLAKGLILPFMKGFNL